MGYLRSCVDIPDFQIFPDTGSFLQHSTHNSGHLRINRDSAGQRNNLPFLNIISDFCFWLNLSVSIRPDQPLDRISCDIAGYTGIRDRASAPDNIAECVSPLCLHHAVAVFPCRESGTHSYNKRGIRNFGAQILFGENGIYNHIRMVPLPAYCFRINHHGNIAFREYLLRRRLIFCQNAFHVLDLRTSGVHGS